MSKVSDALREIEQFARSLRNAGVTGDENAVRGAVTLAAAYLDVCRKVISNPLTYILSNKDPFKDLRPLAQAFIDQWLHPQADGLPHG